ncbi:M14 family metallopeptidase [Erythrobacter sp. F6033]|uniref:M14 family metallopeptidase n=1 Tax=Erythrobacter sp. F6033 TaxID=2926401 RepID=UPI001FF516DA|nr:M14 family metallopeptidase [Erythrobacter sp. F6033]MCK0127617.1 M14 family metallopeptidase [Erythrobacter sp. F6033]
MRLQAMIIGLLVSAVLASTPAHAASEPATKMTLPAAPPECDTKAARIDKDFPTGAYQSCTVADKKHFKLIIAPEDEGDINCSAWYAFRVHAERKTRIKIDLDYTTCGHRYWPKTSTDGVNWDFMDPKFVKVEGERGERTARLTLKVGKEPLFVAAQEVFPPSVYDAWLGEREQASFAAVSVLGRSAHGRAIKLLRIAEPETKHRETVVLVGRQHPPEVTGALAMLPFVETIMGDSDLAKAYRARFETLTVPLLNPDGVVYGHWRHNTGGVDLNRDWGPFTQPETTLMDGLLKAIEADPDRDMRVLIDFHSTNRDVFYTIPDELPTDPELFTKKWLELYQERMPDYEVNRDARHTEGRPISKAHAFDVYGAPGITFEIGDDTDRQLIKRIGRESAIAMMRTLLETPPPANLASAQR